MTATEAALRPCPFCGGTFLNSPKWSEEVGAFIVSCADDLCGATGPTGASEEEAAELWNERPAPGVSALALPPGEECVIAEIAAERRRQIAAEGWSPEHDDAHSRGEMAWAAACYAMPETRTFPETGDRGKFLGMKSFLAAMWPWDWSWWKPKGRRRDLIRAAALIVAEIERLDRAAPPAQQQEPRS